VIWQVEDVTGSWGIWLFRFLSENEGGGKIERLIIHQCMLLDFLIESAYILLPFEGGGWWLCGKRPTLENVVVLPLRNFMLAAYLMT
jgi:hypothetical protein